MAHPETVMINTGDPVNHAVQAQGEGENPEKLSEELKFEASMDPKTFECIICLTTI